MSTDMRKALKHAALLRNLMETCLKAAPAPMTGRELFEWPSIKEQLGTGIPAYSRFSTQLQALIRKGHISKIGVGANTTYAWANDKPATAPVVTKPPELHIRVNRAAHAISFLFEGMSITIEVTS